LLVGCDSLSPETGTKIEAEFESGVERGWDIPTDPQEKAAYDYAQALTLPDSVPKPVPFDFSKAKLKALWPGNPSVSDQYFEHLCNTGRGSISSRRWRT